MNLRPFLLALIFIGGITTTSAKAQGTADLVEVRSLDQAYAPYRERRGTHGFLFGVHYENYYPDAYVSYLDDATYSDMFGNTPIPFVGLELGYKFNFFLGSLAAIYGYSFGSLKDSGIGEERYLELNRNTVKIMYIMDRLFAEPYVAPYVAFGMWDFGLTERITETEAEFSAQTKFGYSYTAGFLIQLNWIEPHSAREAYLGAGLENTYLDIFFTQHTNTSSEEDPTTRTAFDWGAGLRFEF